MAEESELEDDFEIDEDIEFFMHPGDPRVKLVRREAGRNVLDHDEILDRASRLTPHRKLLSLVLLLAMKDWPQELRFEPWKHDDAEGEDALGLRMFFSFSPDQGPERTGDLEIDEIYCPESGGLQELVPPPRYLSTPVLRELESIADLNSPRRRLAHWLRRLACRLDGQEVPPRRGGFLMRVGEHVVEVRMTAYPSEIGPRLFLRLSGV